MNALAEFIIPEFRQDLGPWENSYPQPWQGKIQGGRDWLIQLVSFSEFDPRDKLGKLRGLIAANCNPIFQDRAWQIIRAAGVPERDTKGQAAALLRFVQDRIYYIAKSPETFRSPEFTWQSGYGDCPQKTVLFSTLAECVGIQTELVALGERHGLLGFDWFHVFPCVLYPQHNPVEMIPAETTLPVALGYDPYEHAVRTMGTGNQL